LESSYLIHVLGSFKNRSWANSFKEFSRSGLGICSLEQRVSDKLVSPKTEFCTHKKTKSVPEKEKNQRQINMVENKHHHIFIENCADNML
jgi:hypothetical protein